MTNPIVPVNGNVITPLLFWLMNGLLTIVVALFGLVLKMHKDSVKDQQTQHNKDLKDLKDQVNKDLDVHTKELDLIRSRLHNHGNRVAEIITRMRWQDEDKPKGE